MITCPIPWEPTEYQKKAVEFIKERRYCKLWLDPGLGKTSITLAALSEMKEIKRTLIVAPLRVCNLVWPLEIQKWCNFNHFSYVILHGTKKNIDMHKDADLYIINYDGLAWLSKYYHQIEPFDCIVFDELSKMKAYNTKRFKTIKEYFSAIPYRIGLTGSPAANSMMGLFGQTYSIDSGTTFGRYITHFRNQYFYTEGYKKYNFILKPGAKESMYTKLEPFVMRLNALDCVKMPELIKNNIVIELPPEARNTYNELEKDFISYLNKDDEVIATTAAAKMMKLRQVSSGAVYKTDSKEYYHIHDEKINALKELIEELQGSPLLIIYEYIHEKKRILKEFPKIPCLDSSLSKKQEVEIQRKWNAGELPLLMGHPKSMGHGLNLQASGNHLCFVTTTLDYELYDQTIRRIYRRGAKFQYVFVHHIISKNTIDEIVLVKLRGKKTTQNDLMDALKTSIINQKVKE